MPSLKREIRRVEAMQFNIPLVNVTFTLTQGRRPLRTVDNPYEAVPRDIRGSPSESPATSILQRTAERAIVRVINRMKNNGQLMSGSPAEWDESFVRAMMVRAYPQLSLLIRDRQAQ